MAVATCYWGTNNACARRTGSGLGMCQIAKVRCNPRERELTQTHPLSLTLQTAVDCGRPPSVANAEVTTNGSRVFDVATYHCAIGYRLTGGQRLVCQHEREWEGELPSCTGICIGDLHMLV